MTAKQRTVKNRALTERFLDSPEYKAARSVFFYYSTPEEPDTRVLAADALAAGKTVYLPRIDGDNMLLIPFRAGVPTERNRYGMDEPLGAHSMEVPDLAVVPMLAFDRQKHRLGRGKGFYDRFLSTYSGKSIALAFAEQEWELVPTAEYDRSPQIIITDKERIE